MEDYNENQTVEHITVGIEETITIGDGSVSEETSPEAAEPSEENRVITDALIANDEGEQDPAAEAAAEASEEEEAKNLEEKDEEERLPDLDDGADDGAILAADGEDSGEKTDEPIDPKSLVEVVGVRFRAAGKAYYFAIGNLPVKRGSHIIVETARGLEYGTSVCDPMKIDKKRFKAPVKRIVRMATPSDDKRVSENREKEREAYRVCFGKIREHNLDMKLIDAEYTFDRNKILFYFTSDGRVDFRDLVKDLAGIFHTRIELRQIGVRDETKILGGYGICGRPLCCHTYLADFVPVSIKMAKEQNLSLNPTKISGLCGRLMCCLKNEEDTYEELNKNLPRLGDEVQGADGLSGEVASVNILKQTVRILVEVDDEKELHEYPADQITILRRRKRGQAKPKINRAELKTPGSRPGFRRDRVQAAGDTPQPQNTPEIKAAAGPAEPENGEDRGREGNRRDRGRGRRDGRRQMDQIRNDVKQPDGQSRNSAERPAGDNQNRGQNGGKRPYRKRYNNRRGGNDRGRDGKPAEAGRTD